METFNLLDVCNVYQPKTITTKMFVPDGKFVVYGASGPIGRYNEYNHEESEVVMGCRGACGTINMSQPYSWINGNAMVIHPNGKYAINKKYLMYYLMSADKKIIITGTAQLQITRQNMKDFKIKLCEEKEQERIVSKIEELFSELDAGIETLIKTKEQLAVYRQTILKEMFSICNKTTVEIQEITDSIRIGPFGTMLHKSDYITGGVPIINPQHIKGNKVVANQQTTVTEEKANELESYKLKPNDVIMGRRGEMGRTAPISASEAGWICGTGSIVFRLKKEFDAVFYSKILSSPEVVRFLEENATGTTMKNLNEKIVAHIPVPKVTKSMQSQITKLTEEQLSVCNSIEQSIGVTLQQAEALRQSILKEAFGGGGDHGY